MRLTLKRCELHRSDCHYDHFHGREVLFEVEMSPAQFAELISSPNIGDGVPVTIKWLNGEGPVEAPPFENKRIQFEKEFEQKAREISQTLKKLADRAKELLAKPSLLKKDREELNGLIEQITRETRENIPFLQTMFNEQMDKTVTEVENFVANMVASLGIDELKRLAPQLPEFTNETKKLPKSDSSASAGSV